MDQALKQPNYGVHYQTLNVIDTEEKNIYLQQKHCKTSLR